MKEAFHAQREFMSAPCRILFLNMCVIGRGAVWGTCFSFHMWFVLLLLIVVLRIVGYVKFSK